VRCLIWDIETYPLVVTTWGLRPDSISYENIVEEWGLISASWKWLGEKGVHCVAVDPAKPKDDRLVVQTIYEVLEQADVVVAHYGDRFDIRKLKARAIYHGFGPLPNFRTVDTYKIASRVFGFTSNRLDYLGKFLGLGKKLKTSYGLWTSIMQGDAKALARMVRYNKQDVVLLEKVYLKLRPYMTSHPNAGLDSLAACCPICGSGHFTKKGFKYNRTVTRQQYQCQAPGCGAWFCGEAVAKVKLG
jgi:hypothetical protein